VQLSTRETQVKLVKNEVTRCN